MSRDGATGLHGIITFRLAGQPFGLPVGTVAEVAPLAWLERPPQMPSVVEGILNLGGQAVTVLRLDRLLGLDDGAYGVDSSILIMRTHDGEPGQIGLLVEHVEGVRPIEDYTIQGFPDRRSFNGCVAEQVERGGVTMPVLSWANLLLAEERVRLAEFHAMAQSRLAGLVEPTP